MLRRYGISSFCGLLSASLVCGVLWGQGAAPPKGAGGGKLKPPPKKFSQETEDAFFPDVLKEVGPGRPGGGKPNPGGSTGDTPMNNGGSPEDGGGSGWSGIVSAETLEAEIKNGILAVGPTLESPAKFNTGHRTTREVYSSMALAFAIIADYDKAVRFKDQAPHLREALWKSAGNCKVNSTGAFQEAKKRLDELERLRNGESIELEGEVEKVAPFASVADRRELMKRMELAFDKKLKPFTSNGTEFQANAEEALMQAEYLSLIAKVMQHESYEYTDAEDYMGWAKDLEKGATEIKAAVQQNNLPAAQAAAGIITKACSNCHENYRG